MDPERILQLLAKQMGHAASDEEIAELKKLLSQYPEYYYLKEILQSIEGKKQHQEPAIEEGKLVREGWSMLEQELLFSHTVGESDDNQKIAISGSYDSGITKKINFKKWVRRAAIWSGIIILATGSFYIWRSGETRQIQPVALKMKQVSLPYGAPERKVLPDSSVVWLNAGSHIRYADNFIQKNREIYLEGEAYFDVKHDAGHPFIVHAGNIIIRVLGTEFNVQAYTDENRVETTLINGKVQVQIRGKPDKKIVLTHHEKLTVTNEDFILSGKSIKVQKERSFKVQEVVPTQTATPIPEIAWLQDKLAFQNEAFDELAKKLDRRYDVHIIFRDTSLRDERLSGVFENESIRKALKILQMTTPFNYKIQEDTVYLIY